MKHALVDDDINPREVLRETVGDRISLEFGVETSEEALIAALAGKDVLLTTSRLPVTRRVLEETDLEVVGKIGTGIDNVDLEAARDLGIPVTYTPGVNAQAVAEHAVGLMIAVRRDIVRNYELLASGKWRDEAALTQGLTGQTVGIVGFGRIGSRVAALLSGFNVEILAYDPYVLEQDTDISGAELTSLDDLLERSDVLSINAELTDETEGLIGRRELDLLTDSAVLVNTARGPVVSEDALVEALEEGRLGGAGLDVFETEPLPVDSRLHDFDNVVATPHAAGITRESRVKSVETLVANVLGLLDGERVSDRYIAASPSA